MNSPGCESHFGLGCPLAKSSLSSSVFLRHEGTEGRYVKSTPVFAKRTEFLWETCGDLKVMSHVLSFLMTWGRVSCIQQVTKCELFRFLCLPLTGAGPCLLKFMACALGFRALAMKECPGFRINSNRGKCVYRSLSALSFTRTGTFNTEVCLNSLCLSLLI